MRPVIFVAPGGDRRTLGPLDGGDLGKRAPDGVRYLFDAEWSRFTRPPSRRP